MHLTLLTVSLRHQIKPRHNTSAESCLYMGITSNIHSVMKTRKTKKCKSDVSKLLRKLYMQISLNKSLFAKKSVTIPVCPLKVCPILALQPSCKIT